MAKLKAKVSSPLISNVLKGSLVAVSVSLILILIFALLIKFFNIPDSAIQPVNQVIKIVSILIGVLSGLKKFPQKGLLTGALIGLFYTILAFLIFSLLGGTFSFSATLIIDIIFSLIIGGLCGIFFVNKKLR